jgi:hypothetical protein
LIPYADGYVVSTFDLTTENLDWVVREINKRFNKDFTPVQHTSDVIRNLRRSDRVHPSARERQRDTVKAVLRSQLDGGYYRYLLDRATAVYHELARLAPRVGESSLGPA